MISKGEKSHERSLPFRTTSASSAPQPAGPACACRSVRISLTPTPPLTLTPCLLTVLTVPLTPRLMRPLGSPRRREGGGGSSHSLFSNIQLPCQHHENTWGHNRAAQVMSQAASAVWKRPRLQQNVAILYGAYRTRTTWKTTEALTERSCGPTTNRTFSKSPPDKEHRKSVLCAHLGLRSLFILQRIPWDENS